MGSPSKSPERMNILSDNTRISPGQNIRYGFFPGSPGFRQNGLFRMIQKTCTFFYLPAKILAGGVWSTRTEISKNPCS